VTFKHYASVSAFALLMAVSARADLIGTSVTGQMLIQGNPPNYFESVNGYVPAGYGNSGLGASSTVTIGAGIEFGYADPANTDTADFTGTTVTLQDVSVAGSLPVEYIFTDAAFSGLSLSLDSNNFPAGFTASLVGDVLTLSAPSIGSGGTYLAEYTLSSVPEPSAVILLATVLLAVTLLARKRIASGL